MAGIRWLRVSYWVGAIADAIATVVMLVPELGRRVYGVSGLEVTADYRYAMGLGASLMFGWTVLLLWADRKPVERRGVLMITVLVIFGLAGAGAYAVSSGLISFGNMVPTWVFQAFLAVLFTYSFVRSRNATDYDEPARAGALSTAATRFLSQQRFAVTGVSRGGNAPANLIYRKLKGSGREVYPINPRADMVEGDKCYASLADLPTQVDAVMIATHPDQALAVAQQCGTAGVKHVWFHRSIDAGSVSKEAVAFCRDYGADVIPGGCPMMHLEPVDFGHRCMRGILSFTGKLPKATDLPTS